MTGEQKESGDGKELHEPDQPKIEGAPSQGVHLPADGDDLDLQRDRSRDPYVEKAGVGGLTQQRPRRSG